MGLSKKIAVFLLVFVMASIGVLAINPGESMAKCLALYGVNSTVDSLFSIRNTHSRNVNFIGRLESGYKTNRLQSRFISPSAMAVRPSDGALFVWNNKEKDHGKTIHTGVLLKVDKCTGSAVPVGSKKHPGLGLKALAFGKDGKLYGLNDSLYQIDTETGETRPVGSPSSWLYRKWLRVGAADLDPATGTLYAVEFRHSDSQRIITVNTNTGEVTTVGKVDKKFSPIGSIVFTRKGTLMGSGGWGTRTFLFEMETTGRVLKTWNLKSEHKPNGMAFSSECEKRTQLASLIKCP